MTNVYRVEAGGISMGNFRAESEEGAFEAFAKDAGYRSFRENLAVNFQPKVSHLSDEEQLEEHIEAGAQDVLAFEVVPAEPQTVTVGDEDFVCIPSEPFADSDEHIAWEVRRHPWNNAIRDRDESVTYTWRTARSTPDGAELAGRIDELLNDNDNDSE